LDKVYRIYGDILAIILFVEDVIQLITQFVLTAMINQLQITTFSIRHNIHVVDNVYLDILCLWEIFVLYAQIIVFNV